MVNVSVVIALPSWLLCLLQKTSYQLVVGDCGRKRPMQEMRTALKPSEYSNNPNEVGITTPTHCPPALSDADASATRVTVSELERIWNGSVAPRMTL
jgi:hypothetical protein